MESYSGKGRAAEYGRLGAQAERAGYAGDDKKGVELAKQAIEIDPDRPEAYFTLGSCVTQRESNSHSSDHSRPAHHPHADRKIDSSTLAGSTAVGATGIWGTSASSLRWRGASPTPSRG